MNEVQWRGIESPSTEVCRVTEAPGGVHVHSIIASEHHACEYQLETTADWEFRTLSIATSDRTVQIARTAQGWTVDRVTRPDLAEAVEVDISVSPLSNTLPIRRLGLAVGDSADIVTAYVSVPDLTVTTDPQRYTRLSDREYLYESRDSDFRRTVTVDQDGLVLTYPGLFERAGTA